jgi:hypothetical protein
MSSGVGRELDKRNIDVGSTISQFGWQWEKQFFTSESAGLTMVSEWVALGGGLEQNVLLPSVSWLIGLRTTNGVEFGMGPNLTPAGFALVLAGGMTFRTGLANVPLNVAVVPSKMGTRVSVLSGFSLRREASASRQPVARRAPPRVAPWPPVPVGPWTPPFVGPGTPARVRPQVGALP